MRAVDSFIVVAVGLFAVGAAHAEDFGALLNKTVVVQSTAQLKVCYFTTANGMIYANDVIKGMGNHHVGAEYKIGGTHAYAPPSGCPGTTTASFRGGVLTLHDIQRCPDDRPYGGPTQTIRLRGDSCTATSGAGTLGAYDQPCRIVQGNHLDDCEAQ